MPVGYTLIMYPVGTKERGGRLVMEEMITALVVHCLFIFGCAGSSLLRGLLSSYGSWASHHRVFSCGRMLALGAWAAAVMARGLDGAWASVVEPQGLISCGFWALARTGFSSCGAWT